MKRPLTAILIAPEEQMRADVLSGAKQITIREGHRDYRPGDMVMLACHVQPFAVRARVREVEHTQLMLVGLEALQADGFSSVAEALEALRRFYPDLKVDSPVTVIHWGEVEGRLVDERRAHA